MKRILVSLFVLGLSTIVLNASAVAQTTSGFTDNEKCAGAVYKPDEVSRRAKFTSKPTPSYTDEARTNNVRGRVVLSAVLCQSGKITDIQVIESLPFGMTEQVIQAARQIKFTPAEKDRHEVSQSIRLEYNFGFIGGRHPLAQEPIAGRLVESVEINGLRFIQEEEIWKQVKIRPGETYSQEQMQHDLESILALGYFDSKETYVRVEEGVRGGVNIIFNVKELREKRSTP